MSCKLKKGYAYKINGGLQVFLGGEIYNQSGDGFNDIYLLFVPWKENMEEIDTNNINKYLKRFYQTDEEAVGGTIEESDKVPFNVELKVIKRYVFKPKKAIIRYE